MFFVKSIPFMEFKISFTTLLYNNIRKKSTFITAFIAAFFELLCNFALKKRLPSNRFLIILVVN